MISYKAIYYGYLHHAGKLIDVKVSFVRYGTNITAIHIQDFIFYSFKDALDCLKMLAKDVLTDVTAEELAEMNQKREVML